MTLRDRVKSTLGLTEDRRMARLVAREMSRQTAEVQTFQARQIASAKVQEIARKSGIKLQEQFGLSAIGMPYSDPDQKSYMYRNYTASAGGKKLASLQPDRALSEIHQDYLNRIGVWLYYTNPVIQAAVDIEVGLIVGSGFKVTAQNDKVQKVLDDHWNHYRNNWNELQYAFVLDLKLFGELCIPTTVADHTGTVTLGYIDPYLIGKVEVDQQFPQIPAAVLLKSAMLADNSNNAAGRLKIISHDDDGYYNDGTVFYFTLGKLLSASRGFSPLLCMADWADALDRLIFARGEIRAQIGRYVWDVMIRGGSPTQCAAFAAELDASQGTGIHRVHNENVEFKAEAPTMGASDANDDADLIKGMFLAGAKLPTHWILQQGDTTNRASALAMGDPVCKRLNSEQNRFIGIMRQILDYQLAMTQKNSVTALADVPPEEMGYEVTGSAIAVEDEAQIAMTLLTTSQALVNAEDRGWIDGEEAGDVFKAQLTKLGYKGEIE